MVIFSLVILFWTINSRTYESIYQIQDKVIGNIHEISLDFIINGNNDYAYHFESKDIFFYFDGIIIDEYQKEFSTYNQYVKILFNLTIYEHVPGILEYPSKDIICTENIQADIKFSSLKFKEEHNDFSFGFQYSLRNVDTDVNIHFDNINKLNIFKYIFLEEKKDIYNNKTLLDFIKSSVVANFGKGIIKSLVYYPECDCLYYLHSVIDYITKGTFFIDYRINSLFTINKCSVNNFIFEDIIKDDNRNIILKNINATMYLEIYMDNFDGIASEIYDEENIFLLLDYISISPNKNISYGKNKINREYPFEVLKLIINKTEEILEKKNT